MTTKDLIEISMARKKKEEREKGRGEESVKGKKTGKWISQKRSLDPVNTYLGFYINGQISSSTCAVEKRISMVLLE